MVDDRPKSGTSIWSASVNTNSPSAANWTFRSIILASDITNSAGRIRVTLTAATAGDACGIDNVAIVERSGDSPHGVTIPTEILFAGSSGCLVPIGSSLISDWTDFDLKNDRDYLVVIDMGSNTSNDDVRYSSSGGNGYYYINGSPANSYNTAAMTGAAVLSNLPNGVAIFTKLETAVDQVLNTDIIGELSRDGGTTYSPATLTRSSTGIDGATTQILSGDVDFTGDPSGTNLVGRIRTVNKHKVTVNGIAVNWI